MGFQNFRHIIPEEIFAKSDKRGTAKIFEGNAVYCRSEGGDTRGGCLFVVMLRVFDVSEYGIQ